jgi:hypothetical protein
MTSSLNLFGRHEGGFLFPGNCAQTSIAFTTKFDLKSTLAVESGVIDRRNRILLGRSRFGSVFGSTIASDGLLAATRLRRSSLSPALHGPYSQGKSWM